MYANANANATATAILDPGGFWLLCTGTSLFPMMLLAVIVAIVIVIASNMQN
jgi:hypothetical protein